MIADGLTQGTKLLKQRYWDSDFQSKYISKELVQQFIKMFSSKTDEVHFSIIFQYVDASFHDSSSLSRRLFSLSLNRSFIRIVSCGGPLLMDSVVSTYSILIEKLSLEQKRLITHSGAWPVLLALVKHDKAQVVNAAVSIMVHLVLNRDGEEYFRFVEDNLFSQLMKRLPSQIIDISDVLVRIVGDFPLPACCSTLVTVLTEQVQSKQPQDMKCALKLLASLARCRSLAPSSFTLTLCTLLPIQQTTRCYSPLTVTSLLLPDFTIQTRK
jgi:hypothetical protein